MKKIEADAYAEYGEEDAEAEEEGEKDGAESGKQLADNAFDGT